MAETRKEQTVYCKLQCRIGLHFVLTQGRHQLHSSRPHTLLLYRDQRRCGAYLSWAAATTIWLSASSAPRHGIWQDSKGRHPV